MKKIFLFILCVVFMTACQKGRTYFPKDIEPQEIEFVRFDNALLNVHETSVAEDVKVLEAVDVKGHAAEMTVKGDTIEYNTAAYKIQEGAMVEDLLKKMNGIQVDKEGNVTVNGESVKGVRIDGKKFFGNDVQSSASGSRRDLKDFRI